MPGRRRSHATPGKLLTEGGVYERQERGPVNIKPASSLRAQPEAPHGGRRCQCDAQ